MSLRCALALSFVLSGAQAAPPPSTQAAPDCPPRLRIGLVDRETGVWTSSRDQPPENSRTGKLILAVLQAMGCSAELTQRPLRRLVQELQQGELDMVVGLGDSPERLKLLRFPTDAQGAADVRLALLRVAVVFVARVDKSEHLASSVASGKLRRLRIGALRGSLSEDWLQERGLLPQPITDSRRALLMLRKEHIDLLLLNRAQLPTEALQAAPALAEVGEPVAQHHIYAPVSLQLEREHPAFVRRLWLRLCQASRSVSQDLPPCP